MKKTILTLATAVVTLMAVITGCANGSTDSSSGEQKKDYSKFYTSSYFKPDDIEEIDYDSLSEEDKKILKKTIHKSFPISYIYNIDYSDNELKFWGGALNVSNYDGLKDKYVENTTIFFNQSYKNGIYQFKTTKPESLCFCYEKCFLDYDYSYIIDKIPNVESLSYPIEEFNANVKDRFEQAHVGAIIDDLKIKKNVLTMKGVTDNDVTEIVSLTNDKKIVTTWGKSDYTYQKRREAGKPFDLSCNIYFYGKIENLRSHVDADINPQATGLMIILDNPTNPEAWKNAYPEIKKFPVVLFDFKWAHSDESFIMEAFKHIRNNGNDLSNIPDYDDAN